MAHNALHIEEKKTGGAWDNTAGNVNSALKKYEESVGLAYDDLPLELCEGTKVSLAGSTRKRGAWVII